MGSTHVLSGTLAASDHKHHVPVTFEVPAGTARLVARFSMTPRRAPGALFDHMVCLTVEGPAGMRGTKHDDIVTGFEIGAHTASPGYVPGAIEPGRWTVWLDCFRVVGSAPPSWQLEIALCTEDAASPPVPAVPRGPSRGPGWYRGDLHAHSIHSDAPWPVADLAAFARHRRLDFVTLTDHNTVSGISELERLGGEDLLAMGGVELTTHYGHCLALGTRAWTEWRANSMPGLTMPDIARAVMERGHLYVVAHPCSEGDPSCTGCRWEYDDMMPGPARLVEIWNGQWSDYNEEGLALFHRWLEAGHRLFCTSGTDIHGASERDHAQGFNHVFAESLSEPAVLAAVRAGRNYLSSGPRLVLCGSDGAGRPTMMGDTQAGGVLLAEWSDADDLGLHVVADGVRHDLGSVPATGARALSLPTRWMMVELRGPDGRLHAVTNPVYSAI